MVRQINPSLSRLWIHSNTRQYGSARVLTLEDLTEPELRVLDYLEQGIPDNQLSLLPKMARASEQQTNNLLERLGPLIKRTSSFLPEADSGQIQKQFSEIMRLYLLDHQDPASALRKRKASKVFVSSLNRTGLIITKGLAASGIGSVFTADQKAVLPQDTLDLGYPISEQGNQRARVAKRLIPSTRVELHSRVSSSYEKADVAVLIATDVLPPRVYSQWMNRDVPHLAVIFSEAGVMVSHLVLPGITPCLACVEIHKLEQDPHWAKTAPQLAHLERDLADSSLSLFGASVALSLCLNLIDSIESVGDLVATKMERTSKVLQLEVESRNCGCRLER